MIGRCQGVALVRASVTNRSQRGPRRLESWLRGHATAIICSSGYSPPEGPSLMIALRHLGPEPRRKP
jgi:hypothetical protein